MFFPEFNISCAHGNYHRWKILCKSWLPQRSVLSRNNNNNRKKVKALLGTVAVCQALLVDRAAEQAAAARTGPPRAPRTWTQALQRGKPQPQQQQCWKRRPTTLAPSLLRSNDHQADHLARLIRWLQLLWIPAGLHPSRHIVHFSRWKRTRQDLHRQVVPVKRLCPSLSASAASPPPRKGGSTFIEGRFPARSSLNLPSTN